jgi:D-amino-acid dehydrogenase
LVRSNAVVLGAGIVGVSAALHLHARNFDVVLLDRRGPGEETSFGNAGLVERSSVVPYAFPRDLRTILRYSLNRAPEVRYHLRMLPRLAPFVFSFWWHSAPERLSETTAALLPLIEHSVSEHENLFGAAEAARFFRHTGWLQAFRNGPALDRARKAADALHNYGLSFDILGHRELRGLEPYLTPALVGGVHWHDSLSVSDPGAVTQAYAALFSRRGGRIVRGDARSLRQSGEYWAVDTEAGLLVISHAVVALGPWSDDVYRPLGYRLPMAIKRGYHMHYSVRGNAMLSRPVLDAENGFVLTPMVRGIRLTTGVEFASREALPTPVQIEQAEKRAREIFPLRSRLDDRPWVGNRPALPDMRPVIGPAARHRGLWFAFGHAHHGFTLGPVTGRLIAELIAGEKPVVDPAPFRADRFR